MQGKKSLESGAFMNCQTISTWQQNIAEKREKKKTFIM